MPPRPTEESTRPTHPRQKSRSHRLALRPSVTEAPLRAARRWQPRPAVHLPLGLPLPMPRRGKTAASPAAQRITFSRRVVGRRGQVGRRWAGQASEKGRTSRVQVGHRGEGQASGTNRRSGTGRAEGEGGRPGVGDRPGRTAPAPSHVTISGRSLPNQSAPNACPSYTTLKCLFYLAIYFR